MDQQELEDRLSALVHDAQQQPAGSEERKGALNEFTQEVYRHHRIIIRRYFPKKFPYEWWDDIYDTAMNMFMDEFVRDHKKIEIYNPDKSKQGPKVIKWIQSRFSGQHGNGGYFEKAYQECCAIGEKRVRSDIILDNIEDPNINMWKNLEETW